VRGGKLLYLNADSSRWLLRGDTLDLSQFTDTDSATVAGWGFTSTDSIDVSSWGFRKDSVPQYVYGDSLNLSKMLFIDSTLSTAQIILSSGATGKPHLSFHNYLDYGTYSGGEISYNAMFTGSSWEKQDLTVASYRLFFNRFTENFELWGETSGSLSWGSAIFSIDTIGNVTSNYNDYLGRVAQYHRMYTIDTPQADTFISVKFDTLIDSESNKGNFELGSDSTYFLVKFSGITRIQGCGHWAWNGQAATSVGVYIRATVNSVEARCLQANATREKQETEDGTLPYTGTIVHNENDTIRIQYLVTDTDMDFEGSAVFDNPVSFSVNFEKISN